ncbi:transposase, partial [Arthrobacter sp. 2MCAF14]|uniref:transposase n=1 Tax=Arthrobacter sp. 2MCAF14 TaxID=3232982 RepID=UPI003F927855
SCKTGLPTPIPYKRPSSGRSHRTTKPPSPASQTNNARHPPSFIPGTNAIESLNYQLRKIIKNRGHFPNDTAAVKLLWLAICNIEDKRASERAKLHGKSRDSRHKSIHILIEGSQSQGWNEALGVLALTYPERLAPYPA